MNYYVYFVCWSNVENSPIKIGVSNNVEKRVNSLQTASPYLVKRLHVFEFSGRKAAYDFETFCHKSLGFYNMMGEWFQPGDWNPEKLMGKYLEGEVSAIPLNSAKYALFPTFYSYFVQQGRIEILRCKLDKRRKNRKEAKKKKYDIEAMNENRPILELS